MQKILIFNVIKKELFMKKELTLKEKEKKFKRLARKSKFYDGVWGFRMLYPFVFALGVWGLAFIGISLLIPAILFFIRFIRSKYGFSKFSCYFTFRSSISCHFKLRYKIKNSINSY